ARYGGPLTITHKAYDSFIANPKLDTNNLKRRRFSFSGNGRAQGWKVAWRDVAAHPGLGAGAGTFEPEWYRQRTLHLQVSRAQQLGATGKSRRRRLGMRRIGLPGPPTRSTCSARPSFIRTMRGPRPHPSVTRSPRTPVAGIFGSTSTPPRQDDKPPSRSGGH